jgi:hypothetical protein
MYQILHSHLSVSPIKGLFGIALYAFEGLKNTFNIQKVRLKKKIIHLIKKLKTLLIVQKA